jgi:uncharacterized coiled-coil protein SlyX
MEELFKTINRMIDNQEKSLSELSQKLEEQNKALVKINTRLGKIIEAVK